MIGAKKLQAALVRGQAHAPYLKLLSKRFPETVALLNAGQLGAALSVDIDSTLPAAQALRQAKGRLALSVAIGDLSGALSLDEVMAHLSAFADLALDLAIRTAIVDVVPGAHPQGFAAIALGKHGSRELNYSSDIDPIFLFDPLTLPRRARDESVETAVRIARRVLDIMQARDGDGYVFRVDLRLRPSPEATPLAIPVNAAISYYESAALAWERAAFIRARVCAGDIALGARFLDTIQPFIWRRGLDFGVVQDIRNISHRIRDHYADGQSFAPGYDLKRGRGGIRECEFFVQIQQLIHGGRDPALRDAATSPALRALAAAGWIADADAHALDAAYRTLRTIEHRLQMVDDQQTHRLPKQAAALENVAHLHGLHSGGALLALLAPHVAAVGAIYDQIDTEPAAGLPFGREALAPALAKLGLKNGPDIARRVTTWRSGAYRAIRSASARDALESVLPQLLEAFAKVPNTVMAINRFDQVLERLPSAMNLFLLLNAQPRLVELLAKILSHAPTLATTLAQRADLLDGLIDASALAPMASIEAICARLRHDAPDADLELRLDKIRRVVGELRFALGAQLIAGTADPLNVAHGYARVAEAAVIVATDAAVADFTHRYGSVPGNELVILALGRMGGAELTHASDLDLIFLFTGDYRAQSDGDAPLGAMHYFNRLSQRVIAALSVATAAGPLYDIDTRLRPSGAKGELCVSLSGFERYQREDAWTWEHMALTRARPVYGSIGARMAAEQVITDVFARPTNSTKLFGDAREMRAMIADNKPPQSPLDVKLAPGGLVDLEFCVQVRQLRSGLPHSPYLDAAIAALGFPAQFHGAYQLMTRVLIMLRLVSPDLSLPPPATRKLVALVCQARTWAELMRQLAAAQALVADMWATESRP